MFRSSRYKSLYKRYLGPLSQPVTLMVNNGKGYDEYCGVHAHVSNWRESELIADGTIKIGDLRLIILAESIPCEIDRMQLKDRIKIGDRAYAVIHWDSNTRSIGADTVAIECTVRG